MKGKDMIKNCEDCKFSVRERGWFDYVCTKNNNFQIVTYARLDESECGKEGKYFEPKPAKKSFYKKLLEMFN